MKVSENKDADMRFKFNPCAVPFIPSLASERGNMVFSRLDALPLDTGELAFWNRKEPLLDEYENISKVDEDLYFNCLPSHMFESIENESPKKQSFSVESALDKELSAWLQDEGTFVHSQGENSVCDESWSATPVSSASPPPNDDQDHNSTSYGSLPNNSFAYDMTQTQYECPKEQLGLSEASLDQSESNDRGSNIMRYYSPFGTGVSTWLAGEKSIRKESLRSLKEKINARFPEEFNKDLSTVGNIWNDIDSGRTLGSAAISSWMRQISQDNSEDDLFLRDETNNQAQTSLSKFSSSLDKNPWLSNPEEKIKSSHLGWNAQHAEMRNLFAAENDESTLLPMSLNVHQNYIPYCDKDPSAAMRKDHFIQTSQLKPNSSSHHQYHRHMTHRLHSNVPWLDPNNTPMTVHEPMVYMPQFGQETMNPPTTFPAFYISSSVSVHPNAKHCPMYNPYLMQFAPQMQGILSLDYRASLPQFYPNIDPLMFGSFGIKNQTYFAQNRHSGAALELHQQLDICYEQFRQLENERKKTEAEMARQHPGKEVTSDNTISIPTMPPNPSRIDRLVVDVLREHARVVTLVFRLAQLRRIEFQPNLLIAFEYWMDGAQKLQMCRKNEIINRRKYRMDVRGMAQKERDVAALASALMDLAISTRRARTALWCALQLASIDLPPQCLKQATYVTRLSDQDTGFKSEAEIDFEHGLFGQDVGFSDYQSEFYNDSDQDDGKEELNPGVFCDENEDDLECEVFESDLQQEASFKESDYEVCQEFVRDADDKLHCSLYDGQLQLCLKETMLQESRKKSDNESLSTDSGEEAGDELGRVS